MKKLLMMVTVSGLLLALSGCVTYGPREEAGMLIGGVMGAAIGARLGDEPGELLGMLAGGAIGASMGRAMDDIDRMHMAAALESTRSGVVSKWYNPDTGYYYQMEPVRTYKTVQGPCREYVMDVYIDGRIEEAWGVACRQPDGSWRIVE